MDFHGVVIAEGLEDPTLVNALRVHRAEITDEGHAADYEGTVGRWHLYWVEVDDDAIARIQRNTKHGWYSHFWDGDRLLIVYNDAKFEVSRRDRSSWSQAIEHGQRQGIPSDELDFVPDE